MEKIKFNPIEEKTLNDKLVNLYGKHLVNLYTAVEPLFINDEEAKPALPLLLELKVEDDGSIPYESAEVKVMIFGRETNNWNDISFRKKEEYTDCTYNFNLRTSDEVLHEIRGKHDVDNENEEIYGITDIYSGYCYYDTVTTKARFTKRMNQFADQMRSRLGGKRVETVWNNVYKIGLGGKPHGKCCGQPTARIKDIEQSYFNVVAEEVKILKPDVVIFMTGVEADNAIKEKFGLTDDAFTPIHDELFLHRVDIPGVRYSARTTHPVDRRSNADFDAHNNALIEDILKNI